MTGSQKGHLFPNSSGREIPKILQTWKIILLGLNVWGLGKQAKELKTVVKNKLSLKRISK